MIQLIVLYPQPARVQQFEAAYVKEDGVLMIKN